MGDVPAVKETDVFSRELVVAIPVMGTALAISYDVGYFYGIDINFFTLFSLAEHVVFAIQAVPAAVAIAILLVAFVGTRLDLAVGLKIYNAGKKQQSSTNTAIALFALIAVGILLITIYFRMWQFFVAAAAGFFLAMSRIIGFARRTLYVVSGILVIVAAFTLGYDNARAHVLYDAMNHSIQFDKEMEPSPLPVKVIRSGEKGILYYDTNAKQIVFVKWDKIKKLTSNY